MDVLIIGSEGFIGSNTVKQFKKQGYNVSTADIVLKVEDNYFMINPEMPNFSDLFRSHSYDVCINATGAANVQFSFNYPHADYTLNTSNVFAILEAIRLYNPTCKFINLSSAAVYGNPVRLPINESAEVKPLSPYGYHKLYSEHICKEFFELYGVPTISLRIFSAYGEGLKKQLFWDLYKKVTASRDVVELFGTGKETRDFIYIKDLVYGMDCIMKKAAFNGGVINVASGIESTIEEAVMHFVKACNTKHRIQFTGNEKKGDPLNWRADITQLTSFGFKNTYSLAEGINNYVKWVQEKKLD